MSLLVKAILYTTLARCTFGLSQTGLECKKVFKDAISTKELKPALFSDFESCKPYINVPLDGNLTPLHLAAKKGAVNLIIPFLECGADIDAMDRNHLTPLLQAAISGHVEAVNILLDKGANGDIRSKFGGLYTDYLRMNEPFRSKEPVLDSLLSSSHPYSTHLNDKVTIASECIPKKAKTVTEMVAKPATLSSLLETTSPEYDDLRTNLRNTYPQMLHAYFLEKYEEFKANPPPLSINSIKTTDGGTPLPAHINMCGVVAGRFIPQGSIIAEYTGEIRTTNFFDDTTYYVQEFPNVDGLKFRNDASMMNSAFPNSHVLHMAKGKSFNEGLDGLPFRKLVIALVDIHEGEEIVWNYGEAYKLGQRVELREAAMKHFLETVSWKELIETLKKFDLNTITIEEALYVEEVVNIFNYIIQTDTALEYAVKRGYLNKGHLKLFEQTLERGQLGLLCEDSIKRLIIAAKPILNKKHDL